MEYVELGSTGLKVSRMCLGTGFRSGQDEAACLEALNEAESQGCNFIDTANTYRAGFSERVVGRFLKGRRDKIILTTKVGSKLADGGPAGPGGLSRQNIKASIRDSLERLDTDYVDFYLCHFPDLATPIEETLEAMNELVREGSVRFPGCSNFESWRLCEAIYASEHAGLAPFACNQVRYSLLDRRIEDELLPFARQRGVAVTLWATTAIGLLSGKYRFGQPPPEGTSWYRGPYNYRKAMTERTGQVIDTVIQIASRHGKTPMQVAMAWCLGQPGITSVIIGADTPERVREDFGAVGWKLTGEEVAQLDAVSAGQRLVVHKDCPGGWGKASAEC